ncbi:MAG: hypothetical protein LBS69_12360 [Prevotellaceae bacterium]|jgi:hypothetical protein|nr:hypothetical protein [Prevotellaceae bacterium]
MKYLKIINIFLLSVCALFLFSCSNKKDSTRKAVENFLSTEIIINDNLIPIVHGEVNNTINIPEGIRMIIYYDSIGCRQCRVSHLTDINSIFEYFADSFKIAYPMIIFSPSETEKSELLQNLKDSEFYYPTWLDENNSFMKRNPQIPTEDGFHTFLLDKKNKVVLTGSPVYNLKLWDLYKKTINELITNGGELEK